MRKVWVIARNDLQTALQDKQHWFLLLALPALIIYLAGLGAQEVARSIPTSIRIDVLDQDHSAASNAVVAALAETSGRLLICPAHNNPADACALAGASLSPALAQQRLANEITSAIITIPEGFAEALEPPLSSPPTLGGKEGGAEVTLVFQSGAALAASEVVFWALWNVVIEMGGPIVAARLSTQMADSLGIETGPELYASQLADVKASWADVPPIQATAEFPPRNDRQNAKQVVGAQVLENGFKLSTPSIAVMFVMVSILGMTQALAEERMMGILRRVGMMPVSKAQLLGGKLLSTYLLGLLQFAILLVFGKLLEVDFGSPLAVILVAGSYALAITAMALALAALVRTPQQATGIATFAYMVLAPLGGAWWPLTFVPTWMQTLGHISPIAWCLDAFNALIFHQGTLSDMLGPAGALLLFAVVFFVFGVKKFDYQQSTTKGVTRVLPSF
jgi:ABC-2 type transport system permease protein